MKRIYADLRNWLSQPSAVQVSDDGHCKISVEKPLGKKASPLGLGRIRVLGAKHADGQFTHKVREIARALESLARRGAAIRLEDHPSNFGLGVVEDLHGASMRGWTLAAQVAMMKAGRG